MAALDSQPPLRRERKFEWFDPRRTAVHERRIISDSHFVTPDYFRALQIPLKAGRAFTDADIRPAPLVMVINETLARAAYATTDPIGKRIIVLRGLARQSDVENRRRCRR